MALTYTCDVCGSSAEYTGTLTFPYKRQVGVGESGGVTAVQYYQVPAVRGYYDFCEPCATRCSEMIGQLLKGKG